MHNFLALELNSINNKTNNYFVKLLRGSSGIDWLMLTALSKGTLIHSQNIGSFENIFNICIAEGDESYSSAYMEDTVLVEEGVAAQMKNLSKYRSMGKTTNQTAFILMNDCWMHKLLEAGIGLHCRITTRWQQRAT